MILEKLRVGGVEIIRAKTMKDQILKLIDDEIARYNATLESRKNEAEDFERGVFLGAVEALKFLRKKVEAITQSSPRVWN